MSKFQIITLSIFILFIIAGVTAFATYKGSGSGETLPPITIWGTFPSDIFEQYAAMVSNASTQKFTVSYTEKRPEQFSRDFISVLARGRGPDAILITADMFLPHTDKIYPIPYELISQRDFRDTYIQEGEIYLFPDGLMALPFTIDPLIMFWNRDTFDSAGIATYPRYWDEFDSLVAKLTTKDTNGNIRKSALAMGEFSNITNARELLGSLFLQAGNPIVSRTNNGFSITLFGTQNPSLSSPLQFFVRFADPSNEDYSWNRGLPQSKSAFLGGTLAIYFGFASELGDIHDKNPNLNFDAALLPQLRTGGQKATYGKMYGLSIVRASPNQSATYEVIKALTLPENIAELSRTMYLPTVRRDLITQGSSDSYISIFNQAALVARTWPDPDPADSRQVFTTLVESLTSGRRSITQALNDAQDQYSSLLQQALEE